MLCRMSHSSSSTRPIALVTGPTAGIGLEFARQLAASGHDLVLVARDQARLDETALQLKQEYGASSQVIVADLADRAGMALVETRLAAGVDLLVNNAGYGLKGRFLDNTIEQEQGHLDVLVTAVMRLTHAALGPMVARGTGGVINVSSVAGYLPRGTYSAAKAYVTRFSEWAHNEYAAQGITVMALCPGFIRTEFHERMEVGRDSAPSFLWLDAPDLVSAALKDFEAGKAISVPSVRYKAIVTAAKYIPSGLAQRFQSFGRK